MAKFKSSIEIKIPETVDDWELYRGESGVGAAARDCTKALKKCINNILCGGDPLDAVKTVLEPVLNKHAEFGATDTEPRYHARQPILRACEIKGLDISKLKWEIL